jgi:hypothetical protein
MQYIDRSQHEPRSEQEIDAIAAFTNEFIEGLDLNDSLFDAITNWSPERIIACQQAIFMLHATLDPESCGFEDE